MPSKHGERVAQFYKSKQWKKVRDAYFNNQRGVCERCHKTNKKMIVHHKIELNEFNVLDPNVSLNFDNLELLCIDCHNKEHFSTHKSHHSVNFKPNGEVIIDDCK